MKNIKRIIGILFILTFAILVVGCRRQNSNGGGETNKNLTDEELVQSVINNVNIPESIHTGLDLPTEVDGVKINWTAEDDIILNKDINFYVIEGKEYEVRLFGTFTYKDIEVASTFYVKLESGKNSAISVAWDYFSDKIPTKTVSKFYLRTKKDYNGCTVVYKSLNTDVITDNGNVNQSFDDQKVMFNTYISKDNLTIVYPTEILVSGYTDLQCVEFTLAYVEEQVKQANADNSHKYPDANEEYGTLINWYSLTPGLITANGTVIPPLTAQKVTLGCSVTKGDAVRTLSFTFDNFGGNITKLEQLKIWSEGIIDSYIRGTKNYVGQDDHLTEQVRTNNNGTLNLLLGSPIEIDTTYLIDTSDPTIKTKMWGSGGLGTDTHPAVPQSVLDELFYPGYQMPNDQNILWIVVHESGMPREGQDAKLLAELQVRNAYSTGRQASWHYQVDHNVIYQSFDDSIVCWHAGDGTYKLGGGNNNGIGIEMCINGDGNYEGAMRMDAKLIAHLLHKYNLTLENVKRHYDFDGKQCPFYMIETGRWTEFLEYVNREYMAYQYYQEGARFSWKVTDESGKDVLATHFNQLGGNIYSSKVMKVETTIVVTLTVSYNGETYSFSRKLKLMPGTGLDE